ncbi:membrane associated protein [Cryptosporidium ryanae]|uniref:membrane associated protein n=1 Tax=Cryptosporidium ryanae TaxID=515981 RepID=UPI00351A8BF3|nr:membrane associated protein [Cryptosporidium ryanae]
MIYYPVLGFNLRTEDTDFTKKLSYVLATILVFQCIIEILRVITLTDTTAVFIETWILYLGYVAYLHKTPCTLFIFVSLSLARGVVTLLTTIEWLKKNLGGVEEAGIMKILTLIVYVMTPILSFLASFVSYYIFRNLQIVEDTDDQLNLLLGSWTNINTVVPIGNNQDNLGVSGVNGEGVANGSQNVLNVDSMGVGGIAGGNGNNNTANNNQTTRVIYAPFTGRAYRISDLSSNYGDQKSSDPVYKGT